MRDVLLLSIRHALHHRVRSAILVLCLAVVAFLPAILEILTSRYEASLAARSSETPLVLGTRGNRFDLTLSALYFRSADIEPIAYREFTTLARENLGLPVPLNLRFSARGVPIVATTPEYFGVRSLRADRGTLPLRLGDCVLGSAVARSLAIEPGQHVFSDQRDAFDIARAPALKMRVTGILARAGTPDDDAIFTDIRTAWMLEGAMHGHAGASDVDQRMVYGEVEGNVVLNSALREINEITPENARSFHLHGDEGEMPLSAVLLFPRDGKSATIAKARANASPTLQMLVPKEVVNDLMGFVLRIKSFLDAVAIALASCVALMTILVLLLTIRLRSAEMRTLNRIGCGPLTVVGLYAGELAMIALAAMVLAGFGVGITLALLPDLVRAI